MVPPRMSCFSVKKPKKIASQITISVPQNQCLRNFFVLELVSTNTPERKISPANIKEAIPKPRCIKKSLNQAPVLLSQFCGFTSLEVNSVSVLWSAVHVVRKDTNALKSESHNRTKQLSNACLC